MDEYAPGISGETSFSPAEGGYYVMLYDRAGRLVGRTGFFLSEDKAQEAGKRLAKSVGKKG